MQHGSLGWFSEEGYEHFQHRLAHFPNQTLGAQIANGIQILWIHSSAGMKEALSEAEEIAIDSGSPVRKRHYNK